MYGFDDGPAAERRPAPRRLHGRAPGGHDLPSGGQGLWSTLDDYLAFARLFIGGGAVDGVRLLKPETLALMTTNRLTEAQRASAPGCSACAALAGHGFGLGLAVVMDPPRPTPAGQGRPRHRGLAGRLWRLVAGRPHRQLGHDLPGAQRPGFEATGKRVRIGGLQRDCTVPCAGIGPDVRTGKVRSRDRSGRFVGDRRRSKILRSSRTAGCESLSGCASNIWPRSRDEIPGGRRRFRDFASNTFPHIRVGASGAPPTIGRDVRQREQRAAWRWPRSCWTRWPRRPRRRRADWICET